MFATDLEIIGRCLLFGSGGLLADMIMVLIFSDYSKENLWFLQDIE